MNIGLIDVDSKMPNLALMKISAWHKAQGDLVEWYAGEFDHPDRVYASKVFTFTPDHQYPLEGIEVIKGGSGYDDYSSIPPQISNLPTDIENLCPDYGLYPDMDYSMGFLTRGCPNKCPWCIVWRKEGNIRPAADIEDFCRHDKVLLMDNNVLAHDWGIKQIKKIAKLGVKVDFNQGLDARLIDDSMAKLLSKVKWWKAIRLACDSSSQMKHVHKAVEALRWHNTKPNLFSCYVLMRPGEEEDAMNRARFLKGIYVDPFIQPFKPLDGTSRTPSPLENKITRYFDKYIHRSCWWENYDP